MWYINATLLRYFFFDRLGNNILNLINYKFTIKSQHIISIIEKEIVEKNENVFGPHQLNLYKLVRVLKSSPSK